MLANVQGLNSFKKHLLNNEIDEANRILARKQAVFRDETRAAREMLKNLPCDDLGTSLIPTDITAKHGENIFALRTTPTVFLMLHLLFFLAMKTTPSCYAFWWPENCILTPHFMLTTKYLMKLPDATPNLAEMFCS